MLKTILITGSNRGIGLALTRYYAQLGWQVYACCRRPESADALNELARHNDKISIHSLDVTDTQQIKNLANKLTGIPVDILFNNAGVYGPYDVYLGNTDEAQWLQCMRVNTIAPLKMVEHFTDHVAMSHHKLIATMSSKMASMDDNGSGGSYLYRSSKAALNAVMKSAAIDLLAKQIKVAILHPGWVRTDMTGPEAEITPQESVVRLVKNLAAVSLDNSGSFIDIDGSVIPW